MFVRLVALRLGALALSFCLAACLSETRALAERPPISRILPEDTILYFRIPDPQQTLQDLKQSGSGRMMADEKMRPIAEKLTGVFAEAYAQVEEQVGLSLAELEQIPCGEMTIAVYDLGVGEDPGVVIFLDTQENPQIGDRVVETVERLFVNDGAVRSVETLGDDDELVTLEKPGPGLDDIEVVADDSFLKAVSILRKDDLLVIADRPATAKVVYAFWTGNPKDEDGKPFRRLSDSGKFVTTYDKLKAQDGGDADLIAYVDPIKWVRISLRGNFASMAVMGFFPTLGLDGIQAVGASIDFLGGEGEYEDVQRLYVLLDRPRTGVTKALAMRDVDMTPEEWMPKDVYAYMSFAVDPQVAYAEIEKMYDTIYSEGALEEWRTEDVDERIGVNLKTDMAEALEGRFTLAYWNEPPARFNSGAMCFAAKVKDPEQFALTLEKIFAKNPSPRLEHRRIGEHEYWFLGASEPGRRGRNRGGNDGEEAPRGLDDFPEEEEQEETEQPLGLDDFDEGEGEGERENGQENRREPDDEEEEERISMREQQFIVAIVGDYAMFCDSESFLRKILETQQGKNPKLSEDLDYKLVAAQAATLPGGSKPAYFSFTRPEAQMQQAYELLQGDDLKRLTRNNAESFAPLGSLNKVLEETEFPPFEEFKKYFAPAGAIIVDEENGWSYMGFSLKAK